MSFRNLKKTALRKFCLSAGLLLGFSGAAAKLTAARHSVLARSRDAYSQSPRIGDEPQDETLTAILGLTLQNPEALLALIESEYDKNSPSYRQFLSPEAFANQFSPSPADYQKVLDFAQANRLSVVGTSPNRLIVTVQAKAATLQTAFGVTFGRYRRADGSVFRGLDREPTVDLAVPVAQISGLDNFRRPHSNLVRSAGRTRKNLASSESFGTGTGTEGSFQGYDFRDAYGVPVSLAGSGQTIGLLEFTTYPANYFSSDIAQYEQSSSPQLPGNTPTQVTFADSTLHDNFVDEASLDIEVSLAMAPGAAIVVYDADYEGDGTDALNAMATATPLCRQISCSYSNFGDANTAAALAELAAQGQGVFFSAGDSGAYSQENSDGPVPIPLTLSPFITVVGGTALLTSAPAGSPPSINYASESAWNDPVGSSGGGICTGLLDLPSYQNGVANGSNQASTMWRNIPDVSMDAVDFMIVSAGNFYPDGTPNSYPVDGTSGASPLWAAFSALVNERAAAQGVAPLGFANPALYAIGESPAGSSAFHDITSGNDNDNNTNPVSYDAVGGYDLATGWGSPNGSAMIQALMGEIPLVGTSGLAPAVAHFITYPNPFSVRHTGVLSLRFQAASQSAGLDVFDSAYREVASVNLDAAEAGIGVGQYCGCDGNGRPLAPGVYYAVLKEGGSPQVCKFTVIP